MDLGDLDWASFAPFFAFVWVLCVLLFSVGALFVVLAVAAAGPARRPIAAKEAMICLVILRVSCAGRCSGGSTQ